MGSRVGLATLAVDSGGSAVNDGIGCTLVVAGLLQYLDATRINDQHDHHPDNHGVGILSGYYADRFNTQTVVGGFDDAKT